MLKQDWRGHRRKEPRDANSRLRNKQRPATCIFCCECLRESWERTTFSGGYS